MDRTASGQRHFDGASRGAWDRRSPRERSWQSVALWIVFAVLALLALGGGASAPDTQSLLFIRPACILATGALLCLPREAGGSLRLPLALLGLLAAVIACQLIPLPAALWTRLPQRGGYRDASALLGITVSWHPLSLTPILTFNSLLALAPALVVLVAGTRLKQRQLPVVTIALLVLAVLSAVWGMIQIAAGAPPTFYVYRIVSGNLPDGLWANRNHQATFLASVLPLLAVWATRVRERDPIGRQRSWIAVAIAIVLLLTILATGSRSGILLAGLDVAGAALLLYRSGRWQRRTLRRIVGGVVAAAIGVIALAGVLSGRVTSFSRLATLGDPTSEMRYAAFPVTKRIAADYLPFGSGFGSFDTVFRIHEPDALLQPSYFNRAHNDLLELAITGGVPALLVLLLFLGWFAQRSVALFASRDARTDSTAAGEAAAMLVMTYLLASTTDYPLRTPLAAAIVAIGCMLLEKARGGARRGQPL